MKTDEKKDNFDAILAKENPALFLDFIREKEDLKIFGKNYKRCRSNNIFTYITIIIWAVILIGIPYGRNISWDRCLGCGWGWEFLYFFPPTDNIMRIFAKILFILIGLSVFTALSSYFLYKKNNKKWTKKSHFSFRKDF